MVAQLEGRHRHAQDVRSAGGSRSQKDLRGDQLC